MTETGEARSAESAETRKSKGGGTLFEITIPEAMLRNVERIRIVFVWRPWA